MLSVSERFESLCKSAAERDWSVYVLSAERLKLLFFTEGKIDCSIMFSFLTHALSAHRLESWFSQ